MADEKDFLQGQVISEDLEVTLVEMCRLCHLPAERVIEMVDEGLLEPRGQGPVGWRFTGIGIRRVRRAVRLQEDLGINTAGVALALDLLDELEALRARVRRLEP